MSTPLLHQGATILCMHSGQAQATVPNPRVKVSNQATVQQANPWTVAGCPFVSSGTSQPCVTVQWLTATTRVKSGGQPLLLENSQALCTPNGTGVNAVQVQRRVKAQ